MNGLGSGTQDAHPYPKSWQVTPPPSVRESGPIHCGERDKTSHPGQSKVVSVQVTLQSNKINFYIYLKELLKFIHENWLKFIHENCLSIVEIFGTLFW